jgi:hypothetical protein
MKIKAGLLAAVFCLLFSTGANAADRPSLLEQLGLDVPASEDSFSGGSDSDGDPAQFSKPAEAAYRHYPNYITLGIIRSPGDIDWTNVNTMLEGYAHNTAAVEMGDAHSIGHVAFEIGCTLPSGKSAIVSGQTDTGSITEYLKMLWRNRGYGAFFDYVTGALQSRDFVEKDFGKLSMRNGKMAFVTLLVSPQSCAEAMRYMQAYYDEGVYTRFGLGVRPLYKEGGGCANYAASVTQVAGPSDFAALDKAWTRTFYVPDRLIALGGKDEKDFMDYLGRYDWTPVPNEPYRVLHFFDPDVMYKWAVAANASGLANNQPIVKRYEINASPGFVLDYSSDSSPTGWWLHD